MAYCDVLVVGGGAAGLALAWRLAQRGQQVAVLDSGAAGGASPAAAGMLAPLAEARSDTPFVRLGLDSLALYPLFLEELRAASGLGIGLAGPGMLRVAQTKPEADTLRDALAWQQTLGLPLEWLDRANLLRREPALAPGLVGAVYSPCEQHVTPRLLVEALRLACARAGVVTHADTRLETLAAHGSRVMQAVTPTFSLGCGQLVLAAGAWMGSLGDILGLSLPVVPLRGQALTLTAPLLLPFSHTIYGTGGYLVPRADGRIVVGATEEQAGFDASTTTTGLDGLRAMASRLVPLTANLAGHEHWAGLRPVTPDGLPLLGRAPGWDNVFLAGGHGRNGILLAPLTAQWMTGLVLDEAVPPAEVDPARFGCPL